MDLKLKALEFFCRDMGVEVLTIINNCNSNLYSDTSGMMHKVNLESGGDVYYYLTQDEVIVVFDNCEDKMFSPDFNLVGNIKIESILKINLILENTDKVIRSEILEVFPNLKYLDININFSYDTKLIKLNNLGLDSLKRLTNLSISCGDNKVIALDKTFINCTNLKEVDLTGLKFSDNLNPDLTFSGTSEDLLLKVSPEYIDMFSVRRKEMEFFGLIDGEVIKKGVFGKFFNDVSTVFGKFKV